MESNTKSVTSFVAGKFFKDELIKEEKLRRINVLEEKIKTATKEIDTYCALKEWVKIEDKKIYMVYSEKMFMPDIKEIALSRCDVPFSGKFEGLSGDLISLSRVKKLFQTEKNRNPFCEKDKFGYWSKRKSGDLYFNVRIRYWIGSQSGRINLTDNNTSCTSSNKYWYKNCNSCSGGCNDCVRIPVSDFKYGSLFNELLDKKFIPEGISDNAKKYLKIAFEISDYLAYDDNGNIILDDGFKDDVLADKIDTIDGISFKYAEVEKYITSQKVTLTESSRNIIKEKFLNCDHKRAHLAPYKEDRLNDPNLGHWELWNAEPKENEVKIDTDGKFYGRNPLADIRHDGVVGIDFGTKSTVAAYQNGSEKITLMRIGSEELAEVSEKDYENPTVEEYIDITDFTERYKSSKGRPETLWDDITVSHTARESLLDTARDDSQFYSFFGDIKQWCSDKGSKIILKDQKGIEHELPSFLDIGEGDFDPVEIYAYYLGLFINNMYNGIYLDYLLSFPVTYEKEVRKKIIRSFENGLKKSLPTEVLDDEEAMKGFRVRQGASEPAAYSVCALLQYGYDNIDEEKVFYSVFDFGGGTTDFDFGIWRGAVSTERRFDYVIHHFGAGGDRYLGGENILEMLAFEVFKKNQTIMREKNIKFYCPHDCEPFAGGETLLVMSQEARLNIKQLMEELRPLWERSKGYEKKFENNEIKCSALFDDNGGRVSGLALSVDMDELNGIITGRIEKGVLNFFEALNDVMTEEIAKETDEIIIFLAGNSSRSPIVTELFEKYMPIYSARLKEKFKFKEKPAEVIQKSTQENAEDAADTDITAEKPEKVSSGIFCLFPALGTDEADKIIRERELDTHSNDIMRPTGKTGVAYGLVECRPGSRIKVISEIKAESEIKFSYYLGYNSRKIFKPITDRNIEYNKWIEFIDAAENDFEIYYTSLPEAANGKMPVSAVKKKRCTIDETNEDAVVYIRAVSPTAIEYVAALPDEISSEKYIAEIKRTELEE